jgi:hypothetical protein
MIVEKNGSGPRGLGTMLGERFSSNRLDIPRRLERAQQVGEAGG